MTKVPKDYTFNVTKEDLIYLEKISTDPMDILKVADYQVIMDKSEYKDKIKRA